MLRRNATVRRASEGPAWNTVWLSVSRTPGGRAEATQRAPRGSTVGGHSRSRGSGRAGVRAASGALLGGEDEDVGE